MISNARRCNNVGLTNPKFDARLINHDGILCRYNSSNVSDINSPSPPAWYDDDDDDDDSVNVFVVGIPRTHCR